MELDSFLAAPRWDILQNITKKPSSPTEIADSLDTTISYISQQLKLLEAAGIVVKKRTGAVERGKPRTLYNIKKEVAYVVPLSSELSQKKLIDLTLQKKVILQIWSLENSALHVPLERLFWRIETNIKEITTIAVDTKALAPKVYIASNNPSQKLQSRLKRLNTDLKVEIIQTKSLEKIDDELTSIFDIRNSLQEMDMLKGGNKKL